jgi:long-chain acyl-CoA synthetase
MNDTTIPAMVWARVAAHGPETILRRKALGIWRPITWAELGTRARAIGTALRADGLAPGEVAGILSETTQDWIAADLAIQGAGAASLGVNPTDGREAVAHVLGDSGCAVLFVEGEEQLDKVLHIRDRCPALRRIVIMDMKGLHDFADPMCEALETLVARGEAADRTDPTAWERGIAAIAPDDLAVLAYTAATTGVPRGVMLSHANLMAQVQGAAAMTGQGPADERLAFMPMSLVGERVLGLYQSLFCRSISNLVESAETVPENLAEVRPTVMIAIPRVWQKFYAAIAVAAAGATPVQKALYDWSFRANAARVEAGGHGGGIGDALVLRRARRAVGLDRLRVAWVGGAPVSPALLRWYRCLGIDLREIYGLAECGGLAVAEGISVAHGEMTLSPAGEVLLRGAHVCQGYWRDAPGTRAALRDGWLHTGDLGRIEDGRLVLTGRTADVMAMPDGAQASPALLENELALSPYVADALVARQGDDLVALVMIEFDTVESWAQERNVPFTGFASLARAPQVTELVAQAVAEANARAPAGRRIARFRLIDRDLAAEDGALTPMMKLRRAVVLERFRPLLDEMDRAA